MQELRLYTCCFFGHRKISKNPALKTRLYDVVEELITSQKVHTFLFGSKSQFDGLCYEIVSNLKEKYSYVKRVYVRAEFPHINDDYKNFLLQSYEDTYYPERMINAGKSAYVERNCEMINNSNFCVVYYDKNYAPPRSRSVKRGLFDCQPKSGTKLAYESAVKKRLNIINVIC